MDNETIVGNKLTLVDAKLHFNVNKVELGSGKEVEGAHLVVIDKETGKTVDEWVSEKGKTHDFGDVYKRQILHIFLSKRLLKDVMQEEKIIMVS